MDRTHQEYYELRPHNGDDTVYRNDYHRSNPGPDASPPSAHDAEAVLTPGSWKGEIITLTLSILMQATVVALLIWMDGKPYFQNWTAPLSLASVLAILTAASSAAGLHAVGGAIGQLKWIEYSRSTKPRTLKMWEIYDDCSRGPEGALKALIHLPRSIIILGALVTMASLAKESFTQQTVQLQPRNVTTADDGVTMGFAMEYNTLPRQTALNDFRTPDVASIDPGIRGAIMQGIFGNEVVPAFRCGGGACSWPEIYQTMAITSTCKNVTQATALTKKCAKPQSETRCNMTTPGGVNLTTRHVATNSATVLVLNTTIVPDWKTKVNMQGSSFEAIGPGAELMKLAVYRSTSGPDTFFNAPEIMNEAITECSLSLVLREYRDIRTNGTDFTVAGGLIDRKLGRAYWNETQKVSLNSVFFWNTTADGPNGEERKLDNNLAFCQQDMINMFNYFDSTSFQSEIISGDSKLNQAGGAGSALLSWDNKTTPIFGDHVSKLVGNMAASMSEYLRTSTPGDSVAKGYKVETVVFVHVVWAWLSLPIGVAVFSMVFVVWVMLKNRKAGGLPLWRNSAIAMILHSYDPVQRVLRGPGKPNSSGGWVDAGGDVNMDGVRGMMKHTVTLDIQRRDG